MVGISQLLAELPSSVPTIPLTGTRLTPGSESPLRFTSGVKRRRRRDDRTAFTNTPMTPIRKLNFTTEGERIRTPIIHQKGKTPTVRVQLT